MPGEMDQALTQRVAVRPEILDDVLASQEKAQGNLGKFFGSEKRGQYVLIANHVQRARTPIPALRGPIFFRFEKLPPSDHQAMMLPRNANDPGVEGEGQDAANLETPHPGPHPVRVAIGRPQGLLSEDEVCGSTVAKAFKRSPVTMMSESIQRISS